MTLARVSRPAFFLLSLICFSTVAWADPATRKSEKVERFGYWYVVKKPATFVIAQTGQKGRYTLCSAVLFSKDGSLEFEAKNDQAWSFYASKKGWDYSFGRKKLTLKSGSREIRIPEALYGGSMISGMSHNFLAGRPISMATFRSFISQGKPISIHDNRGRLLVTFPNDGDDLSKAFKRAIECSLSNKP